MSKNTTAAVPPNDQPLVTAAQWFGGGRRVAYDPHATRILTEQQLASTSGALRVFERVAGVKHGPDAVWLTLLPGYPDGSYGLAQVDRLLGDDLCPRLYVEPVGQGDSEKPLHYPYSTIATDFRKPAVSLLRPSCRSGAVYRAALGVAHAPALLNPLTDLE